MALGKRELAWMLQAWLQYGIKTTLYVVLTSFRACVALHPPRVFLCCRSFSFLSCNSVGTLLQQDEVQAAAVSSTALVLMGVIHSLLCSNAGVIQQLQKLAGQVI